MSRTMHTDRDIRRPRSAAALRRPRRTGTRRGVISAHLAGRI